MEKFVWDNVYRQGEQLNHYPYTDVVAFFFRHGLHKKPGLSALDVGCGSGVHSLFLAENGYTVFGFDGSHAVIEYAQKRHAHPQITYEQAFFDDFTPENRTFNLVIDRLSSTQSSPGAIKSLYARIRPALEKDALVLWQGFDWDNSYRAYGELQEDGSYDNFTKGHLQRCGQTVFLKESELAETFPDYRIRQIHRISEENRADGMCISCWQLIMSVP